MRLLSQISREYKGKKYEKFWIVLPSKLIKKLGWKTGTELDADVNNKRLIVQKEDWED